MWFCVLIERSVEVWLCIISCLMVQRSVGFCFVTCSGDTGEYV